MRIKLVRGMVVLAVMAAGLLRTDAAVVPEIKVPFCEVPPVIDGALDDAAWADAWISPAFYEFTIRQANYTPDDNTTARFLTDGHWLYIGMECRHPDPGDMKAEIKQNLGGNIYREDECFKIFLNPGLEEDGQWFRYVLNFMNVYDIRRSFSDQSARPFLPWPSATQITPDGWSAELAVPLFDLAGYGKLENIWLNVFRKKMIRRYDPYQIEIGVDEYNSTLSPTSEWIRRAEMARLTGLNKVLKPEFPFVANMSDITVGEFYAGDAGMCYDINLTLKGMTARTGTVEVVVVEKLPDGTERKVAKTFDLEPYQIMPASMTVPVESMGQRNIDVVIRDSATLMPFQTEQIRDTGGFELLVAMTRFNYHTSEEFAEVLYEIGMSANMLVDNTLVARDAQERELARLNSPESSGTLLLPLRNIAEGRHVFNLALENQAGTRLFNVDFEVVKHPPAPGREWKIDRARGGSLLHDGEPFFPFGFCMDVYEDQVQEVAEAGFNTMLWWTDLGLGVYPRRMTPADAVTVAELAQKHGLKLMIRISKIEDKTPQMTSLKKHFQGKDYEDALWITSFLHWKYLAFTMQSPWNKVARQVRNEVAADWMDMHLPLMLDNVHAVREMPGVMGYKTVDEVPYFRQADLDVELLRATRAVNQVDPYRPMFALYGRSPPDDPKYTDFMDALGTDPYWTPGQTHERGSPNYLACVTAQTVARSRQDGLMPWTIPLVSTWSGTFKRMLNGQDNICQTYLALIHGTRGIIYFTHGWAVTEDQWQALKTLAQRTKVMTPALTGKDPFQEISYTPGIWVPLRNQVPDVQCRLMRFPDGRYVLLAANVRLDPVEVSIRIDGLQDTQRNDLFDGELGAVADGSFTDTIKARGVRSYVFDRIADEKPVRVAVNITPLGEQGLFETGYDNEGRIGMKNILPNPSFEADTAPGWPDYYAGHARRWPNRIGTPDAPVGLTTDNPYHGDKCLFIRRGFGNIYWKVAPQLPTAQPYVFSFYARTESAEPARLTFLSGIFADGNRRNSVEVTGSEWQRYHLNLIIPARYRHPNAVNLLLIAQGGAFANGTVFLDALQLEPGIEPTEFEP